MCSMWHHIFPFWSLHLKVYTRKSNFMDVQKAQVCGKQPKMQSSMAYLSLDRYKLIQQLEASPVVQNIIYLFLLDHILLCMIMVHTYLLFMVSPFCGFDTKQCTTLAFFFLMNSLCLGWQQRYSETNFSTEIV